MQIFTPVDQSAVNQKVVDQFAVDQPTPHQIIVENSVQITTKFSLGLNVLYLFASVI
jgi:hypothetical protein